MRRRGMVAGAAALIAGTLLATGQSLGAKEEPARNSAAIEYVMRTDDVSRAEAIHRLDAQPDQLRTAERLTNELGEARTGGAYIEAGQLIVTVLDDAGAATVRAAGAQPRRVSESIIDIELAGRTAEPVINEPAAGISATQNVTPGLTQVNGNEPCTAGFAAKDSFGFNYMFTAAHCVDNVVPVVNGVPMGDVVKFDKKHDVALIRNLAPFQLQLGPHLFNHDSNKFMTVLDVLPVVPGATVCKEGIAAKHDCGRVLAVGQPGKSKFGEVLDLIKTDMCARGGDSGGPLYIESSFQGYAFAAGITEGAQLFHSNGTPWNHGDQYCGSQLTPPQPDVSYYVPLKRHLGVFGVSLITGQ